MLSRTAIGLLLVSLFSCGIWANASIPTSEPVKTMPVSLGPFHLIGNATELKPEKSMAELSESPHLRSITEARYALATESPLRVSVFRWDSDSAAFGDLATLSRVNRSEIDASSQRIGTASSRTNHTLNFFKGSVSVAIVGLEDKPEIITDFARQFAGTLDSGDGEIPVLVQHLPNWQSVLGRVAYALTSNELTSSLPGQPVLSEVSFDGGAEAVVANYGQSQLVIVEFTTPQFSIDNDQRIWTRIAELKAKGKPAPTAYRRVGNYSVFVFNAPDEKTANALVDQVKYEQVVQWLGDDPHLYERLQRYFTQTSAGVLVAVLKSSGLSLILCLAIGGLIGTMLFRHRRAQKAAGYSDAGGSIRLNLDELTEPVKTGRLLKNAELPEQPSANSQATSAESSH